MMAESSLSDPARILRCAGGAAVLLGLLALPAQAQVIEIDSAGAITTYASPTLFSADRAVPLVTDEAPRAASLASSAELAEAGRRHGLPPNLLEAVAWQESRGRMTALSPKGAIGIMQLMPSTAAALGVDPHDQVENIRGGALYLRRQIDRFRSVELGLAAYNAGPGAVIRFGGIPPYRETRDYVAKVLARWRVTPLEPTNISEPDEVLKL